MGFFVVACGLDAANGIAVGSCGDLANLFLK